MYMAELKIEIPYCPDCNSSARGTVETVPACAEFELGSDGTADYSGNTEAFWEEQETNRDRDGRVELVCENGHHWFSKMDELSE
jgi:hypothetical protein